MKNMMKLAGVAAAMALVGGSIYVMQNKDMALKYSEEQSADIKATFKKYFEELDKNIQQKSNELINQINDKEHLEENLARNQKKLDWLNKIKQEIDSALEI